VIQPIALLVALALVASGPAPTDPGSSAAPPPPPPPPSTTATPPATPVPTPVQPTTAAPDEPPPPTVTPKPTKPGEAKRVYMPGVRKEEVVLPTAVEPTPVRPTPVLPSGPQPVLPGTDPDERGTVTQPAVTPDERKRRTRRDRQPRVRAEAGVDASPTGRCFAAGERCRAMAITGIAMSAVGLGIVGGGAALLGQPMHPLRDDPTQVKSFRPPGGAMVAIGGAALVAGLVVLAVGVVGHKRDQALRRQAAWWRPRVSVGILW
jgi:hypothetical protein